MSEYQEVRVVDVNGSHVTLKIKDVHPDMALLGHFVQAPDAFKGDHACGFLLGCAVEELTSNGYSFLDALGPLGELEERSLVSALLNSITLRDVQTLNDRDQFGEPMHEVTVELEWVHPEHAAQFRKGALMYSLATLDDPVSALYGLY